MSRALVGGLTAVALIGACTDLGGLSSSGDPAASDGGPKSTSSSSSSSSSSSGQPVQGDGGGPDAGAPDGGSSSGLIPPPEPGVRCGSGMACAVGQVCCAGGGSSMCQSSCPPGSLLACDEPGDCGIGQVCCATLFGSSDPPIVQNTTCAGSCTAEVCRTDAQCPSGKHCMPGGLLSPPNIAFCQ